MLSQTGRPLRIIPDSEETENMLEDVDEGEEEEEGSRPDIDVTWSDVIQDGACVGSPLAKLSNFRCPVFVLCLS